MGRWRLVSGDSICSVRRKIRLIESNAKSRYLQKITYERTLRCFNCLRPPPLLWPHTTPPPPYTLCIQYTYSHREGGEGRGGGRANQREGYSRNCSQTPSKIPTWLTVSPVYKHQRREAFRLVHGSVNSGNHVGAQVFIWYIYIFHYMV